MGLMLNNPTPGAVRRSLPPRITEARSLGGHLLGVQIMRVRVPFLYSSLAVVLFLNSIMSLGCCVNRMGWGWYPTLLISIFGFMFTVQMWNYTADQK
jgi:hypothetical protein